MSRPQSSKADTTSELRAILERFRKQCVNKGGGIGFEQTIADLEALLAAQKQRWELYGRLHQTVELFQTGRISSVVYSAEHARITDDLATLDGVIGEAVGQSDTERKQ